MRFAHLARFKVAGRLRRNGIRKGTGRRGSGVYAVPLFRLVVESFKEPGHFDCDKLDQSTEVSSTRLWRHLFRENSGRLSKALVVVFSAPSHCWPLDLYLTLAPGVTPALFRELDNLSSKGFTIVPKVREFVEEAASKGYRADLEFSVAGSKALGTILQCFLKVGGKAWAYGDDTIEVVFRHSIPARSIEKLIPLYRTNDLFRVVKNRSNK